MMEVFRKEPLAAPVLLFSARTTEAPFFGRFLRLSPTAASPRWLVWSSRSLYATDGTAAEVVRAARAHEQFGVTRSLRVIA